MVTFSAIPKWDFHELHITLSYIKLLGVAPIAAAGNVFVWALWMRLLMLVGGG